MITELALPPTLSINIEFMEIFGPLCVLNAQKPWGLNKYCWASIYHIEDHNLSLGGTPSIKLCHLLTKEICPLGSWPDQGWVALIYANYC